MNEQTESGLEPEVKKIYVIDTNVAITNPKCIIDLRAKGHLLVIPGTVIIELDNLKVRPDIGLDAREALTIIEEARKQDDKSLLIEWRTNFSKLPLPDHQKPDHQIIATVNQVVLNFKSPNKTYGPDYKKIIFISNDRTVRLLAHEVIKCNGSFSVEEYRRDKVKVAVKPDILKKIRVAHSEIHSSSNTFSFKSKVKQKQVAEVLENEGVICVSNYNPSTKQVETEYKDRFVALKRGSLFKIIDPKISASGVSAFSMNGNGPNWQQQIALAQLLDPDIQCVFLQGGAGTGKTLLATAAALEMQELYHKTMISRPMVSLEDKDNMGYLPGDIKSKMSPWTMPIVQSLEFIEMSDRQSKKAAKEDAIANSGKSGKKRVSKRKTFEEPEKQPENDIFTRNRIIIVPLDYIRGSTWFKSFVIIDEAQNLSPHQVKTIITRMGLRSKLVFTGDLGQIDRKKISDALSSGLAYASSKMKGNPMISVINFSETVRSPLAAYAEEVL